MQTVVQVVEEDYEKVRAGQTVEIQVDAFPEQTFPGQVVRKAPVLDPETRAGAVQIEIENPRFGLKPGMYARVSIVARRRPQTRVLPLVALLEHTEQPSVFVVRGSPPKVALQEVKMGVANASVVEILEGVADNDRVVTLGARMVKDGQEVTALEPEK